jgi:hypothetical protein
MKSRIKFKTTILVIIVLQINFSYAQSPCDLNGPGGNTPISTKPVPYTGQDYKTNTFDWKAGPKLNVQIH